MSTILLALFAALLPVQDEIPRARAVLADADAGVTRARDLGAQLRARETELRDLLTSARAPLPERPAEVGADDGPSIEELTARGDAWAAWLQALDARRLASTVGHEGLDELGELVPEAEAALRDAAQKLEAARTRAGDVSAAIAAGTLAADPAGRDPWDAELVADDLERLDEALRGARSAVEGSKALFAEVRALEDEVEAPDPDELRAAEVQVDAFEVLQATAAVLKVRRAELVQGGDPGTVRQALHDSTEEWSLRSAELEDARAELRGFAAELEDLEARLDASRGPEEPPVPDGPEHLELRRARRDLAYAEAVLAWRESRLALLTEERALLARIDEALGAGAPVLRAASAPLLELLAARAALEEFVAAGRLTPDEVPPAGPEDSWSEARLLAVLEADRRSYRASFRERLAVDRSAAARDDVAARRERVERARAEVAREEEYAAFFEELRGYDAQALLDELDPDGEAEARLVAARSDIAAREAALEESRRSAEPLLDDLDDLLAPRARAEVEAHPDRYAEIRAELESLAADPQRILPVDTSADPTRRRELEERLRAGRAAPRDEPTKPTDAFLSPTPEELADLEAEHRRASEQIAYFDGYEDELGRLRAGADEITAGENAVLAAIEELLALERRRVAVAREAARRGPSAELDLEELQRPDRVDEVLKQRTAFTLGVQRRRALRERFLDRCDVILGMKGWAGRRGEAARERVDLIDAPVERVRAARRTVADLAGYERENLRYRADQLELAETPWRVTFLARFSDARRRQRAADTLDAYYLELVDLQRVQAEFAGALSAYRDLIEVTGRMQDELEPARTDARANEAAHLEEYQIQRHVAGIAADPDRRVRIQASFREEHGYDLFMPADDHAWDRAHWADRLATAEARLWGARGIVADLDWALSRQGIEAELGRFRKHLASVEAERAENEARQEQVRAQIAELRASYDRELREQGLRTLGKLAAIPVVAFLVVQVLRRAARTMRRRIVTEDVSDRRRRLETLANVMTATIRVVVWAIALIYMLKALGLDVTPIIASASVAGLAVAFGAQSLVKDLFAGFFILLENQYGVGDIVDVGSANGTVEHISLRVTILRDLQGNVHYVPNGLIQRVSNKTKGWSRVVLEISVPYGEDVDRVSDLMKDVLSEMRSDARFSDRILEDPVVAGVESFGDSTMNLRLMVKVEPGEQWGIAREVRARIKRALDRAGIDAPVPRRIVQGPAAAAAQD